MIGVIGGSGLYSLDNLKVLSRENPSTPWGYASSPGITLAQTSCMYLNPTLITKQLE